MPRSQRCLGAFLPIVRCGTPGATASCNPDFSNCRPRRGGGGTPALGARHSDVDPGDGVRRIHGGRCSWVTAAERWSRPRRRGACQRRAARSDERLAHESAARRRRRGGLAGRRCALVPRTAHPRASAGGGYKKHPGCRRECSCAARVATPGGRPKRGRDDDRQRHRRKQRPAGARGREGRRRRGPARAVCSAAASPFVTEQRRGDRSSRRHFSAPATRDHAGSRTATHAAA